MATPPTQSWSCNTGLPSDIRLRVHESTFYLHKFPLMLKSKRIHHLITEIERGTDSSVTSSVDGVCEISFDEFPGNSETFETIAKFCYGVKIDITSSTVVSLRCAAQFLCMTEDHCDDNLISRTEKFFSQSVLTNPTESIRALRSCQVLQSMDEELNFTQRCVDSIAMAAFSINISLENETKPVLWNGIETGATRLNTSCGDGNHSWLESLSLLDLLLFNRVIISMKNLNITAVNVEIILFSYGKKRLHGLSPSIRKSIPSQSPLPSPQEQKQTLEILAMNLPPDTGWVSTTFTRFLFGMLRTSYMLTASQASMESIEKKLGSLLQQATVDDLLIPNYSDSVETLYNVECVEKIVHNFFSAISKGKKSTAGVGLVGKLIDGYLSEIASDENLKPEKFCRLAAAIPEEAREVDDGVYRAVDLYLSTHRWIKEEERERVGEMVKFQRLTAEARAHAVENEWLPLRAVVQVMAMEQRELRRAVAARPSWVGEEIGGMRWRVEELEKECGEMKKKITVLEKGVKKAGGWRNALSRKLGCRFRTQVRDLNEQCSSGGKGGGRR